MKSDKTFSGLIGQPLNRRHLLKSAAGMGVATAALSSASCGGGGGGGGSSSGGGGGNTGGNPGNGGSTIGDADLQATYDLREDIAFQHAIEGDTLGPQQVNNDESDYTDKRGSFSKVLPHNLQGEASIASYDQLVAALLAKDYGQLEAVELAAGHTRNLASPLGAVTENLVGMHPKAGRIAAAPSFSSAQVAAEMGEVYWQALTRDVAYVDYGSNTTIADAATDLNNFSHNIGPLPIVTPSNIFRGQSKAADGSISELAGPYISQFLYHPIPYGAHIIDQKYSVTLPNSDHMVSVDDYVDVQNGTVPGSELFDPTKRYIFNNRALGSYVHVDAVFQSCLNAALILMGWGASTTDVFESSDPYINSATQEGFVNFGIAHILDMVTIVARQALHAAWYQKWMVHRRARPEVYGARVHFHKTGAKNYDIHADLLNSAALDEVQTKYSSYLLPQAYPEGSPTHPAYPAGHAAFSGACVTVLKAYFNESAPIVNVAPDVFEADDTGSNLLSYNGSDRSSLTVGDELNKLASNISLGRDAAGVHYRTDGTEGNLLGEQVALSILRDYSRTYPEDFTGFSLVKFDGTPVSIVDGVIS